MTRELTRIPAPARSSFGHAITAGKLFVIGGHTGRFHEYGATNFASTFNAYDFSSGAWVNLRPYPQACQGFRVVARGDYLYAFGGFISDRRIPERPWPARSSDALYRYSISTDRWDLLDTMPHRRSSYVCGVIADKAYLIGGWDATPSELGDSRGRFVKPIDVFDLVQEKFLPTCLEFPALRLRRAFSATVRDGEIVLAGGLGEQGFMTSDLFADVIVWRPPVSECEPDRDNPAGYKQGHWSLLPQLPLPLFSPGVGRQGKDLIIAGGVQPLLSPYSGSSTTTILRLAANTGWEVLSSRLREARSFVEVAGMPSGSTLFIGGHRGFEADRLPSDLIEII